jgi:hypothetical protein
MKSYIGGTDMIEALIIALIIAGKAASKSKR